MPRSPVGSRRYFFTEKKRQPPKPPEQVTLRVLRDDEIFATEKVWRVDPEREKETVKTGKSEDFRHRKGSRERKRKDGGTGTHCKPSNIDGELGSKWQKNRSRGGETMEKRVGGGVSKRGGRTKRRGKIYKYWMTKGKEEGAYRALRTVSEMLGQFDKLPWTINRDKKEGEYQGGVKRLAEICFQAAKVAIAKGDATDFHGVPDDIAFWLIEGSCGPRVLEEMEERMPERVNVIDAAWAKLCKAGYKVEKLEDHYPRWRALYEIRDEEKNVKMEAVSKRMRAMYDALQKESEKHRLARELVPYLPTKRKFAGSSVGRNPLERLKLKIRQGRGR